MALVARKPGNAAPAVTPTESELVSLGSLNQYRTDNEMLVGSKVVASKESGYPTIYLKSKDNKIHGIVLSKNAGELYPVGTEVDMDNMSICDRGDKGLICCLSSVEWI